MYNIRILMNHNKIRAFLIKNNIEKFDKYTLFDNGDGIICLIKWGYDIPEPTKTDIKSLTKEEIRGAKFNELKNNRAKFFNDPDFIKFMFSDIDEVIEEYLNLDINNKLFDE